MHMEMMSSFGARHNWPLAAATPKHLAPEVLQQQASHSKSLDVLPVHDPGIREVYIYCIRKHPHVPPLGFHGGAVEVDQHVTLVNAPHVGIVALDDSRAAYQFLPHCSTGRLRIWAPPHVC